MSESNDNKADNDNHNSSARILANYVIANKSILENYKDLNGSTSQILKKQQESVEDLLEMINEYKQKTNDRIFIVSAIYDKTYAKYNSISLLILILSSVTTLMEALRLSIVEFVRAVELNANVDTITFTMNTCILVCGTVITVLSSIIRFRNYREILEQLQNSRNQLIVYRDKYSKKYHIVMNLRALNELSEQEIKSIRDRIIEYDDNIKSINILQYLRNKDILKFNKYKAYFDVEMKKIDIDKQNAIELYESKLNKKNEASNRTLKDNVANLQKFLAIQKLKNIFANQKKTEANNGTDDNEIKI